MACSDDYVTLSPGPAGGLTVPLAPLRLLWDLEARGFTLTPNGTDINIRPFSQLTAEDRAALRRWKPHVLALLSYEAPEVAS